MKRKIREQSIRYCSNYGRHTLSRRFLYLAVIITTTSVFFSSSLNENKTYADLGFCCGGEGPSFNELISDNAIVYIGTIIEQELDKCGQENTLSVDQVLIGNTTESSVIFLNECVLDGDALPHGSIGDSFLIFAKDSPKDRIQCSPLVTLSEASLDNAESPIDYENQILNQLRVYLYTENISSVGMSFDDLIIIILFVVAIVLIVYFLKRRKRK